MQAAFKKIYKTHLPNIRLGSMDKPVLIVFSAIPGSGKSELTKRLVEKYGVSCIANKDIRKSLEQTGHADDVVISDYTLWLLDKLTEKSPRTLVFDRNIDQWYEPIKDWATRNDYKLVVVQIEVSRAILEKRLRTREGDGVSHVLGVLDYYHKEHERMAQSMQANIVLRDDYDLDKATQLIVDTIAKGGRI
jgi:predicted kinase